MSCPKWPPNPSSLIGASMSIVCGPVDVPATGSFSLFSRVDSIPGPSPNNMPWNMRKHEFPFTFGPQETIYLVERCFDATGMSHQFRGTCVEAHVAETLVVSHQRETAVIFAHCDFFRSRLVQAELRFDVYVSEIVNEGFRREIVWKFFFKCYFRLL